jgi:general stress protein 26
MAADPEQHLYDLLKDFSTVMLVTHEQNGGIHGRPMAIAKLAADSETYFATDRRSPKVAAIKTNPDVAITAQSSSEFASLTGRVEVTEDRALVEEFWSPAWEVWFPGGKDDPNLVLLKFTPVEAEYWDNSGAEGLRYAFEGLRAYIKGERPNIDDGIHAKVDF